MKKFDDYTAAELFAMRKNDPRRYTALLNEKYGTEGQAVEGLPTAVAVRPIVPPATESDREFNNRAAKQFAERQKQRGNVN